jgi:hypothetical protein
MRVIGQSCRLGTVVTARWARSGCSCHRSVVVASPSPFDSPSAKLESCAAAARLVEGLVEWRWDVPCLGCSRWPAPMRLCLASQCVPPYSACLASRRAHAVLLSLSAFFYKLSCLAHSHPLRFGPLSLGPSLSLCCLLARRLGHSPWQAGDHVPLPPFLTASLRNLRPIPRAGAWYRNLAGSPTRA